MICHNTQGRDSEDFMKMLARVALLPIIIVLRIMGVAVDLIIKIECWAAGIVFLFLGICISLAVMNQLWLQTGIFAGMFGTGVLVLLLTAEVKLFIEGLIDRITV